MIKGSVGSSRGDFFEGNANVRRMGLGEFALLDAVRGVKANETMALLAEAICLNNLGRARDAERCLVRAVEAEVDGALEVLTNVVSTTGDYPLVKQVLGEAIARNVPGAHRLLGVVLAESGDLPGALLEFGQALEDGDERTWLDRGVAFLEDGNLTAAAADIEMALRGGDEKAHWAAGSLSLMRDERQAALEHLSLAIHLGIDGVVPELALAAAAVGDLELVRALARDIAGDGELMTELVACLEWYEDQFQAEVDLIRGVVQRALGEGAGG